MSIVVSDTSPIRALAHVHQVELLQRLFGEVLIPPAVVRELSAPRRGSSIDVRDWTFIKMRSPLKQELVLELARSLDGGEAEALALAIEVKADAVLLDEADGRAEAKRRKLASTGTIGILVRAKKEGFIPTVRPLLEDLRDRTQFFISPALMADSLRRAGE